jgi:hypothetical protein
MQALKGLADPKVYRRVFAETNPFSPENAQVPTKNKPVSSRSGSLPKSAISPIDVLLFAPFPNRPVFSVFLLGLPTNS